MKIILHLRKKIHEINFRK